MDLNNKSKNELGAKGRFNQQLHFICMVDFKMMSPENVQKIYDIIQEDAKGE